jgi:hypothetical protein
MENEVELINHELHTLRQMIEQLPAGVCLLLLNQLGKLIDAFVIRDKKFTTLLQTNIDDAILAIKLQEFDLDMTRREKAALQERLGDIS